MSVKLMSKAWETELKANPLLVLLAMCDFANDEGELYPSLKTLANKARVSKTTLSYILNAFEIMNVITRTKRKRDNGSDTSTHYKINHFRISLKVFQKAYNEVRKSNKSSQCEHGGCSPSVNTQNQNVNTQNAKCEHLEPSYINHQYINHHSIGKILPKDIITFYYQYISTLQEKIKEIKSVNAMKLIPPTDNLQMILTGLENYSKTITNKKYIKSLLNFIQDRTYQDYQEPKKVEVSKTDNKTNDMIREAFQNHNTDEEIEDVRIIS